MKSEHYEHITLPNGIRLLYVNDDSPIAYAGFAVNVGTRDEHDDEQGMAHFVEHMLFKGTTSRKSWHILNRLESIGGELDAYTTKEETFLYATVPTAFSERAVELLGDVLFHSTFPAGEIEKEVEVIMDEIQSYNDSPSELIYDEFEELLFPNSPIGRNILGKMEQLQGFTTEKTIAFVNRCYTTDQLLFFYQGDLSMNKIVRWAEKYFAVRLSHRSYERALPSDYEVKQIVSKKDTFQTHCLLGTRAYDMHDDNKLKLTLLNNILGGPNMSSKLNLSVREKHGYAYNIESGFTPYTDTGVLSVYFGCDAKYHKKSLALVRKEMELLTQVKLNDKQLKRAMLQLSGQMLIAGQNKENLLLAMAKSVLHGLPLTSYADTVMKLNTITADELLTTAQELLVWDNFVKLIYQ